jgi:hypothetical protein
LNGPTVKIISHKVYDGGIASLNKRVLEIYCSHIEVGFPKAIQYDNGATVPEVAYWNEYGTTRGIPARPFLRPAIYGNMNTYRQALKVLMRQILLGKITVTQHWGLLGQMAVKNIRDEIDNTRTPPNAMSTAIRKASKTKAGHKIGPIYVHPLIDSGTMRKSVSYITVKDESI